MSLRLKKRLLILAVFQLLILLLSYMIYQKISLISYINISFYFASAFLLSGLLIYTVYTGFFDVISKSFNLAFTRGKDERKFNDVPGLSELINIDQKPLFFYGFWMGFLMLIALTVFYILQT
ncbi:DUF3899 domain-containing protein [Bacillus sp. MRMR6]|uniref:DUF3899 domain-containing protein n=1 Tax=Bacillus sp. MRMR6 TaxID=1928617 RepID=UPI0009527A90|nr:DUF3899 domain-containing protein [Bacillus sp. MRMR6]OLS41811.1 hypothetical protein BTR25_00095 [Bacillus sp. MRMR6]